MTNGEFYPTIGNPSFNNISPQPPKHTGLHKLSKPPEPSGLHKLPKPPEPFSEKLGPIPGKQEFYVKPGYFFQGLKLVIHPWKYSRLLHVENLEPDRQNRKW